MQHFSNKPANAYSSTSDEIIPLDDGTQEVSLNVDEWRKSVIRKFMKTCRLCDHRYGIASYVMSIQDWQELPGHVVGPTIGPFIPPVVQGTSKPRIRMIVINDNDTGGRLEKKKVNNKRFEDVTTAVAICRDLLIESLGEVIAKALEIRDDSFGQITSSCLQIMNWVNDEYGTLATVSISKIIDDLSDPLDHASPVAFRAHCSKFAANRKLLEDSNNDLPEFLYVKYFNSSCSHFPAIVKLISRFTILSVEVLPPQEVTQPEIATYVQRLLSRLTHAQIMETTEEAEQTFPAKTFSAKHFSKMSPRMATALAAIPANYRAELEAAYGEDMDAEEPIQTAAVSITTNRPPTNSKVGGSTKAPPTVEDGPKYPHYCYFHGYNQTHDGTDCKHMKSNADYTTTMKKARTHDAPALKAAKISGCTYKSDNKGPSRRK